MASLYPAIGSWYVELSTGQLFEIVAVDDKYGTIEIQYEDGDIAEYDAESWGHLNVAMTAAPETGGSQFGSTYDNDFSDDLYTNPLDDFEPETFHGFDDLF